MSKQQNGHNQNDEYNNENTQADTGKGENFAEEMLKKSLEGAGFPQNKEDQAEEQAALAAPEQQIAELQAQLADIQDQLLRKAAEFENFRKRMTQEKQLAIEYANQSLLLDLIPIIDDFERALQSAESSREFNALQEGITMIEKRMSSQLESKWGLKRFNSAGELFDPNLHEAFMVETSPNVSEAIVEEDLMKGYFLKDRVIRAAKVKVIMPEKTNP